MKTLVTGGTGFIGRHVLGLLETDAPGRAVIGTRHTLPGPAAQLLLGEFDDLKIGPAELEPFEAIVHTAAITAVRNQEEFKRLHAVNVAGTLALARRAAQAGVKRFVFLSSAKVGGETTQMGGPLTEQDVPAPQHAYGRSKQAAEEGLIRIAEASSMSVTIIRPPLVYGAGVRGNFLMLAKAVAKGIPMPLGQARALRSIVGVRNLADAIRVSLRHPAAANRCFYVTDAVDVSTADLLALLGRALNVPPRILNVQPGLLALLAGLVRKRGIYDRLFEPFQVRSALLRNSLEWTPPHSVEQELAEFARYYKFAR